MKRRKIPRDIRCAVYRRDGHRCQRCETRGTRKNRLSLHHTNGNPTDIRPEILVVVCERCHQLLHHGKRKGGEL
jgi:5-methylcytosine-specific restriction endonuclease McrA